MGGEAGLVYFDARSVQARTGRMNRPDALFSGAMTDPQGWNRYGYVANRPLTLTDPTGMLQSPYVIDAPHRSSFHGISSW